LITLRALILVRQVLLVAAAAERSADHGETTATIRRRFRQWVRFVRQPCLLASGVTLNPEPAGPAIPLSCE
jgi:hypothetical protein